MRINPLYKAVTLIFFILMAFSCKTTDDQKDNIPPGALKGEFKFKSVTGEAVFIYNDKGPAASDLGINAYVSVKDGLPGAVVSWGLIVKRDGQVLLELDSASNPESLLGMIPGIEFIIFESRALIFFWNDYADKKALFQADGEYSAELSLKIRCMLSSIVTELYQNVQLTHKKEWTPFE